MAHTLVIMESPTKCKTVEQYLGSDYKVVSSNGHISSLKKTGKLRLGIDLETYIPDYRVDKTAKDLFLKLKKMSAKYKHIVLATDPDREGEAIAQHLNNFLEIANKSSRVRFNEITADSILEAFKNENIIDLNLVKAQETRRILDRMIGFRLSYLLYKKIRMRSAGRVQSVGLKLIVDKEKERNAFKVKEYWSITGKIKSNEFTLTKYKGKKLIIPTEDQVKNICKTLNSDFKITNIVERNKKQNPFKPYRTSTLMQDAANILNFSAARTSLLAQRLYEGVAINGQLRSLITYPRTDSSRYADKFILSANKYIIKHHGAEYINKKIVFANRTKNVQDAHEAIRIISPELSPDQLTAVLTKPDLQLYTLIYNRTLGSLMKPAVFKNQKITLHNNGYDFVFTNSEIDFKGYLLYANTKYSSNSLKVIGTIGDVIKLQELTAHQHFTKPPARYSVAKLIEKLEELGIGRPSTYSLIISTLIKRNYVRIVSKALVPQPSGFLTNTFLQSVFPEIINEQYTSDIEEKLNLIASGEMNSFNVIDDFWTKFEQKVEDALETIPAVAQEMVNSKCPKCNKELVYRNGRYGKFIGCLGFPKCRFVESLTAAHGSCPKCGSGQLVVKHSKRNRKFLGCSLYKENNCDYIEQWEPKRHKTEDNTDAEPVVERKQIIIKL